MYRDVDEEVEMITKEELIEYLKENDINYYFDYDGNLLFNDGLVFRPYMNAFLGSKLTIKSISFYERRVGKNCPAILPCYSSNEIPFDRLHSFLFRPVWYKKYKITDLMMED